MFTPPPVTTYLYTYQCTYQWTYVGLNPKSLAPPPLSQLVIRRSLGSPPGRDEHHRVLPKLTT